MTPILDSSMSSSGRYLLLKPSPLRPPCRADERIFLWRGINVPPPSVINDITIQALAALASRASLRDPASYGSGLRKFHLFCDIFTIPEAQRLPASFELLHSFALWAASDPEVIELGFPSPVPFEPVSVSVVRKYLAAVRAWHITQGWPPPLTDDKLTQISWSLRGLDNILAGKRKRPPRPPVTLNMLRALKATLDITLSFDACIWAMCTCAFWGMMRFGEVSVKSRAAFDGTKHLKRRDAFIGTDLSGKPYARLSLPSAKTAGPGQTQQVFVAEEEGLCPLEALENLSRVVPAGPDDPLFSWYDDKGHIRPMTKSPALQRINTILSAWGWGTAFGHSFRIGGASLYLARKVNPEVIRIAGRWRSLAYEVYIRAFEQVVTQHLGNAVHGGSV